MKGHYLLLILLNIYINTTTYGLTCYECICSGATPDCSCTSPTSNNDSDAVCVIIRDNSDNSANTDEHLSLIKRNETETYIENSYFVLMKESIQYNDTSEKWIPRPDTVIFGCDWDMCNNPNLTTLLPSTIQMSLPSDWLNENILDTKKNVTYCDCHHCPNSSTCGNSTDFDISRCPNKVDCNSTCKLSQVYREPHSDPYCYKSECLPVSSLQDSPRVEITAIYYFDQSSSPTYDAFNIPEFNIFCRADNCSRPEIFTEFRDKFTYNISNLEAFMNLRPSATTSVFDSSTVTSEAPTTSTGTPGAATTSTGTPGAATTSTGTSTAGTTSTVTSAASTTSTGTSAEATTS
ncbi:unnamed protein product, partial [Didymodactylos carnosus]